MRRGRLLGLWLAGWLLWPALALAEGGAVLPLGNPAGGLSASLGTVGLVRRLSAEAKARVTRPGRKELEQVLVVPQRPGQTNVRYYDFDWRRYDFLDDHGVGGVRFYFYEREADTARLAAAIVRQEYEELARTFHYRPTTRVPYILYNSHREFENTNVFFVNEAVLGVTSPLDLRMALPYWGEQELFRHVSKHEMTHQFQIQKMADRARAAGVESPISQMPLWFTEGLAEFYSLGGVDLETDMFARDMLLNPRPKVGYTVQPFWSDARHSYLDTYKLGQLKVAFLADQYGPRFLQTIIDESPKMSAGGSELDDGDKDKDAFKALVSRLAREKPERIAQRFSAWMKRRYLRQYLSSTQEPPAIAPVEKLPGEPDAFSATGDGQLLLYRSVTRQSGRSRLYLVDRRDPESARQVAVDGHPGIESLHPVLRGVTALSPHELAFFARDGAADALYVLPFRRRVEGKKVSFELGRRRRIDLASRDLIEAGDPTFSPGGQRLAFFALDTVGKIDIWLAEVATGKLTRLTDDAYAERDLNWVADAPSVYGIPVAPGGGRDGTLLFTSDRTEDGHLNLAAMDPATGQRARLCDEPADERMPYGLGGGRVVFSSDAQGKQDLHLYDAKSGEVTRLTDFVTGLTSPAPGPVGLTALGFFGGEFRLFDVPRRALLTLDERPAIPEATLPPPRPLVREPIPDQMPAYRPFALKNWRLQNGIAAVGTASVGEGALLFGDVMSDRNVLVQLAMFGSPELTDALAFYIDKSGRDLWGFGPFHAFTQRRDTGAPGFGTDVFYLQREFGLTGMWSHPFDTYSSLQARVVAQGVKREFEFPLTADGFLNEEINLDSLRTWDAEHGGYDLEGLVSLTYGYDTTRYRYPGGAYGGGSLVAELGAGWLPLRHDTHGYLTFDAQYHLALFNFAVLHLRFAGGASGGSVFGRQFFLSSYDNLRNYDVNDRRLLGTVYDVTNANLAIPLDSILRLALVSNVQGILGMDFGGVATRIGDLWPNRSLAYVLGVNLGLGPFELRFHFAHPIDIGGMKQPDEWVPNISLQYAYF